MSSSISQTARLNSPAGLRTQAPTSRHPLVVLLSRLREQFVANRREAAARREKEALLRRARRLASSNPSFAADLFAAAGRDLDEYDAFR